MFTRYDEPESRFPGLDSLWVRQRAQNRKPRTVSRGVFSFDITSSLTNVSYAVKPKSHEQEIVLGNTWEHCKCMFSS